MLLLVVHSIAISALARFSEMKLADLQSLRTDGNALFHADTCNGGRPPRQSLDEFCCELLQSLKSQLSALIGFCQKILLCCALDPSGSQCLSSLLAV